MRTVLRYALLFILPIVFFSGFLASVQLVNNWRLLQFSRHLFNYELPPETVVIDRYSEVDLLGGTGNQCGFIAEQILETTLSKQNIEDYFLSANIPPVMKSHVASVTLFVNFEEESQQGNVIRFRLSAVDIGYEDFWSYWDIRCG